MNERTSWMLYRNYKRANCVLKVVQLRKMLNLKQNSTKIAI